mmetsp:Transcript_69407/g.181895  ORF Transcript_69407/g.181895 Transcript_69407/m.181895 type:complete len:431 (+) Transcript_69407:640-1932(+)
MACASTDGFQAGSTRMTRSAPVMVRPVPPTWMLRQTQKYLEPSCWNLEIFRSRSFASMLPSMRRNFRPSTRRTQAWMRSSMRVLCEKIRQRWPRFCSWGSSTESTRSLQESSVAPWTEPGSSARSRGSTWVISGAGCVDMSSASKSPASSMATRAPSEDEDEAAAHGVVWLHWVSSPPPEAAIWLRHWLNSSAGRFISGWLQSFFSNAMARRASMPHLLSPVARRTMSLLRYRLYSSCWAGVRFSHRTTSIFDGSSCATSPAASPSADSMPTSDFMRRRKWGAVRRFSSRARWSLSSTAKRVAFRFEPFAIWSEKFLSKVAWLPSRPGCEKSMSAQRSPSLFCSGVPVRRKRDLDSNFRRARPETQDGFLSACASSTITTSQGRVWSLSSTMSSPPASSGLSSSWTARPSLRLRFLGRDVAEHARPEVRM